MLSKAFLASLNSCLAFICSFFLAFLPYRLPAALIRPGATAKPIWARASGFLSGEAFFLNGDSIYPYSLYVMENNLTVCEHISGQYLMLGGSSRPINYEVIDHHNKIINIYVQETYANINGYNYYYYSKLRFKKL